MDQRLHWLLDTPEWMQEGSCVRAANPDWWFPEKGGPAATAETRLAVDICHACPVQLQCLAYANTRRERGIWGGLTEQQRASRRKRARRTHSATTLEGPNKWAL